MNLKLLTAAAVVTTVAAAPAFAHDYIARSTSIRHDPVQVYHYGSGYWRGDVVPRIPSETLEAGSARALFAYDPHAYYDALFNGGYRHCWGTTFVGPNGPRRWRSC